MVNGRFNADIDKKFCSNQIQSDKQIQCGTDLKFYLIQKEIKEVQDMQSQQINCIAKIQQTMNLGEPPQIDP